MNEFELSQLFAEELRLYAERIRNNQVLGPFKRLLDEKEVTVKVQLNPLSFTSVEQPKQEEPLPPITEQFKVKKREKTQIENPNP